MAKQASLAGMDDEPSLDDDLRELANRLFATATGMLEDAIEPADTGQSPHLTLPQLAEIGRRLQVAIREIAVIAHAATIVTTLSDAEHLDPWKTPLLKELDFTTRASVDG